MINPEKILQQILGGVDDHSRGGKGGSSSGLLKGAALGGLASMILGSKAGRKMGGSALKIGGMAALGGLAYNAWRNYQAQQQGTSIKGPATAEGTEFLPEESAAREELGLTLLGAMIAAAKADGHIDGAEEARIFAKVDESDLDAEEKGLLMDLLRKPPTIEELSAKANSPERAVEIYAASMLAIDPDQEAEKEYLNRLASRLGIVPALRQSVEAEVRTTGTG
jgi:uncharacterized membrane protein YebE (DUF533 family)